MADQYQRRELRNRTVLIRSWSRSNGLGTARLRDPDTHQNGQQHNIPVSRLRLFIINVILEQDLSHVIRQNSIPEHMMDEDLPGLSTIDIPYPDHEATSHVIRASDNPPTVVRVTVGGRSSASSSETPVRQEAPVEDPIVNERDEDANELADGYDQQPSIESMNLERLAYIHPNNQLRTTPANTFDETLEGDSMLPQLSASAEANEVYQKLLSIRRGEEVTDREILTILDKVHAILMGFDEKYAYLFDRLGDMYQKISQVIFAETNMRRRNADVCMNQINLYRANRQAVEQNPNSNFNTTLLEAMMKDIETACQAAECLTRPWSSKLQCLFSPESSCKVLKPVETTIGSQSALATLAESYDKCVICYEMKQACVSYGFNCTHSTCIECYDGMVELSKGKPILCPYCREPVTTLASLGKHGDRYTIVIRSPDKIPVFHH